MNYDWVQPTLQRIADILAMPHLHNSYGTPKASPKLAWDALRFFWPHTTSVTPIPRVQPNKNGGIEFIWSGIDTEILVLVNPEEQPKIPRVHYLRGTTVGRQGMFTTEEQVFEAALRQVERELDPAYVMEMPRP